MTSPTYGPARTHGRGEPGVPVAGEGEGDRRQRVLEWRVRLSGPSRGTQQRKMWPTWHALEQHESTERVASVWGPHRSSAYSNVGHVSPSCLANASHFLFTFSFFFFRLTSLILDLVFLYIEIEVVWNFWSFNWIWCFFCILLFIFMFWWVFLWMDFYNENDSQVKSHPN